jgi:hypothetical protein
MTFILIFIVMSHQITLCIKLTKPPPGIDFSLQKGSGNSYETVQKQISGNGDLMFEFPVTCNGDKQKDNLPKLGGPYVQGPAGAKFIYIGIGTFAGNKNSNWTRRLKVPLTGITWFMIDKILAATNAVLETNVPGTGKDGGPNCATVKPFNGWQLTAIV